MKLLIISVFIIFILVSLAEAAEVQVDIAEVIDGRVFIPEQTEITGAVKINPELTNMGSIALDANAKMEIFRNSEKIFSIRSGKKQIMPGERESFHMYWFEPAIKENLMTKIYVYYSDKVHEEEIQLKLNTEENPIDVFELYDFRTYDDYIRFDVICNKTLENIIIFISEYPEEWHTEQKLIKKLIKNRDQEVIIPFEINSFSPQIIEINIVTEDGKFYEKRELLMKKEEGISYHINIFQDFLNNPLYI